MANQVNVQDAFLNYVRKNKIPVTIFLLNGVKLTGTVSCFDKHCVIVKRETYIQFVYKHAISTFSPHGSVPMFDVSGDVGPQRGDTQPQKQRSVSHVDNSNDAYEYDYVYDGDE